MTLHRGFSDPTSSPAVAVGGIGDVNSVARGSGARYNDGKPAVDLIPLRMIVDSYVDPQRSRAERLPPVHAASYAVGEFQESGDPRALDAAIRELRDYWPQCARVFDYGRGRRADGRRRHARAALQTARENARRPRRVCGRRRVGERSPRRTQPAGNHAADRAGRSAMTSPPPAVTLLAVKKTPATAATRVRASEARKLAAGGRRMPGGVMPPDAAEALAVLEANAFGDSSASCIYRAIIVAAEQFTKPDRKR